MYTLELLSFSSTLFKKATVSSWYWCWISMKKNSLRASSPIWASEGSCARTRERAAPRSRVSSRVPLARVLFTISPKWRACSQARKRIVCEQAFRNALAAGQEKGAGELATTSLEFEYLHWKSRCEVLIGGDDISNDAITLGTCISMFALIGEFKFQRRSCKLDLLPFPDSTPERPG